MKMNRIIALFSLALLLYAATGSGTEGVASDKAFDNSGLLLAQGSNNPADTESENAFEDEEFRDEDIDVSIEKQVGEKKGYPDDEQWC